MSRLGAKTYSRKPESKAAMQFDQLIGEKGNKPSTAKASVATVHRWGMASFTSLRKAHLNGQKDVTENMDSVKRVKLEPKTPFGDDPFSFETDIDMPSAKHVSMHNSSTKLCSGSNFGLENKPIASKPNKFFKSGASRLLVTGTSSSRKNDFDALRLSISNNCNSHKLESVNQGFLKCRYTSPHDSSVQSRKDSEMLKSAIPSAPVHLKLLTDESLHTVSTCFSEATSHYSDTVSFPDGRANKFSELFESNINSNYSEDRLIDISVDIHTQLPSCLQNAVVEDCNNMVSDLVVHSKSESNFSDIKFKSEDDCEVIGDSSVAVNTYNNDLSSKNSKFSSSPSDFLVFKPDHQPSLQIENKSVNTNQVESDGDSRESFLPHTSSKQLNEEKLKNPSRPKKIFSTTKKPKAVYNHRHWQASKDQELDTEMLKEEHNESEQDVEASPEIEAVPDTCIEKPAVVTVYDETINAVHCARPVKKLYTVVKNVKQAYQCHESGETQEFNDDIEYLLEGVQESNAIATRCLSVLSLATKCMGPAFRIHLRAHGTMPKIFSALQDAPNDPNLALCTATLMFVLSQDRLTMDIEASTLSMMLQLLETDQEPGDPDKELDLILEDPALCAMQEKHREKVFQLCEQMQQKGHAKHLRLNNINTGILAMETLLSLTSRKAGEWFKEEIRILRGLDHIVDTISSCVSVLIPEETIVISSPTEIHLDKIRKIDRCLRVLENVTYMNFENQDYLMKYQDAVLISSCLNLMKICKMNLLQNEPLFIDTHSEDTSEKKSYSPVLCCLLSVLKVLLNITHENPSGSTYMGSCYNFMELVLLCILQVPKAVPTEKRFDLLVLSLGLMINLVEHCCENRRQFMELCVLGSFDSVNDGFEMLAPEALVEVLLLRLEAARLSEEQADELLNSQEEKHVALIDKKDVDSIASQAECLEETLMKTLQKAGKHMEHSIIAAYISLLLGCVIQNNEAYATILKDYVPDGKFDVMIEVLRKFMSFVSLTGVVGNTGVKSLQRIIEVLVSS